MICGHIHYATIRDEHGIRYMNCGDWVESCTALVEHEDGRFEIITWTDPLRRAAPVALGRGARRLMRILVATDAWHPQVNGVVRTLTMMAEAAQGARRRGRLSHPAIVSHLCDAELSATCGWRCRRPAKIARLIADARPDSIHIATEGPIGLSVRRYCRKHGLPFTTSFHTRFPDYVSARAAGSRILDLGGAARGFTARSQAVMAATPALASELRSRGFRNVVLWPRGVDTALFHPRDVDLGLPRPVFLCVGRVAVEKNLEAFLDLDLPGTKVIVGDGPARAALDAKLSASRVSRRAAGRGTGGGLCRAPTSSCFRARPTPLAWCCWKRWPAACRWPPFR